MGQRPSPGPAQDIRNHVPSRRAEFEVPPRCVATRLMGRVISHGGHRPLCPLTSYRELEVPGCSSRCFG